MLPASRSLSGRVMLSGEPVAVADFGPTSGWRAAREHLRLGPAILFPLGEPGNVRGVFTVGREPGAMPLTPQAIEMISRSRRRRPSSWNWPSAAATPSGWPCCRTGTGSPGTCTTW